MQIVIYSLKNPITNEIRYIGQTNNPKRRLNRHINNSKDVKDKRHINNWIRTLTIAPIMDIIEICEYSVKNDRENYWINYYKNQGCNLCNCSNGGAGPGVGNTNCLGRIVSEKTRQKISSANKGKKSTHGKGGAPGKTIYQYDKSGNLLGIFKSILNASKTLNICRRTIKNSLSNKKIQRNRSLYKWSYTQIHDLV